MQYLLTEDEMRRIEVDKETSKRTINQLCRRIASSENWLDKEGNPTIEGHKCVLDGDRYGYCSCAGSFECPVKEICTVEGRRFPK